MKTLKIVLIIIGIIAVLALTMRFWSPGIIMVSNYFKAAQCKKDGGSWTVAGMSGGSICVHTFSDGGKTCDSSDQCQGDCIVTMNSDLGNCQKDDDPFGCFASIENFKQWHFVTCTD